MPTPTAAGRPPWFLALLLALCAFVNYGVFRAHDLVGSIKGLKDARASLEAQREQLPPYRETASLEAEVAAIESRRGGLDARAAALATRVAPEPERPALDLRITRLAEQSGLLVEKQEQPRAASAPFTRAWTLRGTFGRVRGFLRQLAALDRRVVVTELSLERDRDAPVHAQGWLTIRLTVSP
jgi:hypothetical protein